MSTIQQNTTKAQRRPHKKPQHGTQNSRSIVSDNDIYNNFLGDNVENGEIYTKSRRRSQVTKKGYVQSDTAAYSDSPTQRPVSHHNKTQATPVKQQAYAGPTFHQSPAASALPLPSFYSKSLPTTSPFKADIDGSNSPGKLPSEVNACGVADSLQQPEPKRESTPLDFLFDAARKANATPGTESPSHRHYLSSAANTPVSRSPAPRENEADFPFELDASDRAESEHISTLSTPYKDRIEAAKLQMTTSSGAKILNEDERKTKSAQLKQFLMNSAQTMGGSADSNPFNARPAPQQHWQYRHHSNPNTPYNGPSQNYYQQQQHQQYFPPMPPMPPTPTGHHYRSPSRQGQFSNLRNVYQPGADPASPLPNGESYEQRRISTARDLKPSQSNFADIYGSSKIKENQTLNQRGNPSAQELEDDLRKFLKLDAGTRV